MSNHQIFSKSKGHLVRTSLRDPLPDREYDPEAILASAHFKSCARLLLRHIADCERCTGSLLNGDTGCDLRRALIEEVNIALERSARAIGGQPSKFHITDLSFVVQLTNQTSK